jgi:hypothetical protein
MNELLETIRVAIADGATDEQRTRAAGACRTLLTALEAEVGKAIPVAGAPTVVKIDPTQALDLLIAKLRAALPADAAAALPADQGVRFAFVHPRRR